MFCVCVCVCVCFVVFVLYLWLRVCVCDVDGLWEETNQVQWQTHKRWLLNICWWFLHCVIITHDLHWSTFKCCSLINDSLFCMIHVFFTSFLCCFILVLIMQASKHATSSLNMMISVKTNAYNIQRYHNTNHHHDCCWNAVYTFLAVHLRWVILYLWV
jgi:hypothetical protein